MHAYSLRLHFLRSPIRWVQGAGWFPVRLQAAVGSTRLKIRQDGRWFVPGVTSTDLIEVKPVESLVWSVLAALRVRKPDGALVWLVSTSRGRSDGLFRRWMSTLPKARLTDGHGEQP